jgi:hypothetical protein
MEGGAYFFFQRKQKSKVFCILFFFPVWLEKQFINSDRRSLKSFQTTVELVGNVVRGPKFSYEFSTCSSLPKF